MLDIISDFVQNNKFASILLIFVIVLACVLIFNKCKTGFWIVNEKKYKEIKEKKKKEEEKKNKEENKKKEIKDISKDISKDMKDKIIKEYLKNRGDEKITIIEEKTEEKSNPLIIKDLEKSVILEK